MAGCSPCERLGTETRFLEYKLDKSISLGLTAFLLCNCGKEVALTVSVGHPPKVKGGCKKITQTLEKDA
ncbi:hypothetical protein A2701_04735 [Candidatus Amesbacteria bacterium RIFCSPHIGHO2_01_FULL_47_34]|uniref:Uncharacterized protein n=1 Tax=Candidatus Amesbacteria bacterium RIFCSPLOWO2_01_FULL_47_33 TaxID=1797258 RepID=A0A1F4Z761_9BACT|nr:MAG: hypothetical protein A2701_04735 [Candidatus Amesbacteria bacterium RIFCSPHIGHO2_01_FULL_47_34]OGD01264.1 MAG: hypothetical protein A2972_03430 [Candidatus Amesbacteria bacterium RIFCSPLOWO2_01_FULL_47_33]